MRDHFREDENELPYLVWQRRDRDEDRGQSYSDEDDFEPLNISFNNIPYSQFSSYVRRLQLTSDQKARLISSIEIKPRNCTFSINQNGDDDHYGYKVNFASRRLEEYHIYPFHEYFLFF